MNATRDAERAAFEATVGKDRDIHRAASGDYMSTYVQNDWGVWQVACKEIQRAACNFCLSEAAKARAVLPIDFKQATDQGERYPEGFDASCGIPARFMRAANMTCASLTGNRTWDVKCVAAVLQFVAQESQSEAAPTLLGVADGDAVGGKSGGQS